MRSDPRSGGQLADIEPDETESLRVAVITWLGWFKNARIQCPSNIRNALRNGFGFPMVTIERPYTSVAVHASTIFPTEKCDDH